MRPVDPQLIKNAVSPVRTPAILAYIITRLTQPIWGSTFRQDLFNIAPIIILEQFILRTDRNSEKRQIKIP